MARPIETLRSHPGRSGAGALALLLTLGTAVAVVSGPPGDRSAGDEAVESNAALGLSSGSGSAPEEAAYDRAAGGAAPPAPAPGSPAVGPGGLGGAPVPEAVASGTSRVIKTAVLSVGVDKDGLAGAYQAAHDAAARAGGWVQSSEQASDQATLVLKIPSDRFDAALASLRALGEVRSDSVTGEDVSSEYVDLEARLKHWRAQEAVFLELMAKAETIPETISIQQQLSVIQEQIEQLEGRRRYLDGQTAFSTVRLSILEVGAVAKDPAEEAPRTTLARAWEQAAGAALAVVGGSLVVLGVVVPLALILGIPAGLVAFARRRQNRPPAPAAGQG